MNFQKEGRKNIVLHRWRGGRVWISDFWTWHGYCIHRLTEAVSACISPVQNQGSQSFKMDEAPAVLDELLRVDDC